MAFRIPSSNWLPALAATAVMLSGTPAAGQGRAANLESYRLEQLQRPGLLNNAGLFGLNTLLGGASVALVRALRGGSFAEAFLGGAAAGALVYSGKVVAAQRFSGAGLAGRQLAAVGGSVASNVAAGASPLARLELPVGPARLVVDRRAGRLGLRVDPFGVAALTYAIIDPRLRLDGMATLSSGTPVFRGDGPALTVPMSGANAVGLELYSVILLADLSAFDARTRADILAHERVHTIQADAFQAFWGRALLEWIAPQSAGWQKTVGMIDLNLGEATAELVDRLFARRGLWEIEADYVGR